MDRQIGLLVTVKIQRPHPHPLFNGCFEDARQNFLAIANDAARDSDLQGNQSGAHCQPFLARGAEGLAASETQLQMIFVLAPPVQLVSNNFLSMNVAYRFA
jgi:hypothetical protein